MARRDEAFLSKIGAGKEAAEEERRMRDDAMPCVVREDVSSPFNDTQRQALVALTMALSLGIVTQSLFWNARLGLNFFLWDVSRLPLRLFARFPRIPAAAVAALTLPFRIVGASQKTRALRVLCGLILGLSAAAIFAQLFSSDPEFGSLIADAFRGAHHAIWFALSSILTAAGYLFAHALQSVPGAGAPSKPLPPPVPTVLRRPDAAGDASVYRDWPDWRPASQSTEAPSPEALARAKKEHGATLSCETWGAVLLPIISVFGLFVGVNVRHAFRGDAYVRNAWAPSYSQYLHAGFYQLLAATILSLCIVLTGHAFLRSPGAANAERRIPGGNAIRTLEVTLLALTIVTLFSCAERLALYEEAYGATYLRLGVAAVALAVLGVLVLSVVKVSVQRTAS